LKELAMALPAPREILLDQNRIYFSDHGSIDTRFMAKDGSGEMSFGGPQIFPGVLALSNGKLFWTNESNAKGDVLEIDTTTLPNDIPTKIAVDLAEPSGLVVVGSYLYFTDANTNLSTGCASSDYAGALMRCPTSGCVTMMCGAGGPITLQNGMQQPRGLTSDALGLVWADAKAGTIYACNVPTCMTKTTLATGQGSPLDTASDGTTIYWTNNATNELVACPRASCDADKKAIASSLGGPRLIALDTDRIYWTNANGNVMRCDLPDCAAPVVLAKGLKSPWGIAIDATYTYVVAEGSQGETSMDGSVFRMPKGSAVGREQPLDDVKRRIAEARPAARAR